MLIRKICLCFNVGRRLSVNICVLVLIGVFHASGHPWIVDDKVAPDRPLDSAVLSRLKQFSAMNKLKKMALRVSCLVWLFVTAT